MPNVRRILVALFFAAGLLATAAGQSTVTLGESSAALVGPWKFHTGDNAQWADAAYDDSSWGTVSLLPKLVDIPAYRGASYRAKLYFVPGWTAQGYPGYSGYAWYRLRVTVNREHEDPRDAGQPLAISIPPEFDDAYQIYIDGRLARRVWKIHPERCHLVSRAAAGVHAGSQYPLRNHVDGRNSRVDVARDLSLRSGTRAVCMCRRS